MAKTYVPGFRLAIDVMRRYVAKYSTKLENNTSPFLWALASLLLDVAEILLAVLSAQTPMGEAYDPDIVLDTSGYINQVQGAFNKFFDAIGETEID